MPRTLTLAVLALALSATAAARNPTLQPASAPGSAAKIASATSAAPASISANATIMDWPATEGGQPTRLRAGTNGWTCFPDQPQTPGNDPMCLDAPFEQWARAWMERGTPQITRVGVSYMLSADAGSSNTDPYATAATATNEWAKDPPHVMIVVPDVRALEGMPTDRDNGGPWVMWRGTPYAHLMVPLDRH